MTRLALKQARIGRADLVAGMSVAGLLLPEAVAYAEIAGLPAQRAIFAAIAGCLVYALAGRSRFAIVSPTSSSAAILAATLGTLPASEAGKAFMATIVVALTGVFFLIAAGARLGGLTGFISRPVLRGFAFGLAVTIIVRQLPLFVGVDAVGSDIFHLGADVLERLPGWNPISLAVGAASLAALLILRRLPAVPGALIVLVAAIALSRAVDLPAHGVAVVGPIALTPQWASMPSLTWAEISRLAQFSLPLVLILFAESWGTMRALALRHGDTVSANREMGALGLANIASALVQGMPVGAGFSAGSASESAGAVSRATGAIAAATLAILLACAAPLIASLPQPALAAVVMAALTHSLDPSPFVRLWRLNRDQYIALAAAIAVLALGVLNGMLVAIALSLAALVRRLATPQVARLGRLGQGHNYVDVARHPDAIAPPHIAIWRPLEPLFFANAERTLEIIADRTRAEPDRTAVVLSLEESVDLDSSALDALLDFDRTMSALGVQLQLARLHDRARDLLAASGAADLETRSSYSVDDAVEALQKRISGKDPDR